MPLQPPFLDLSQAQAIAADQPQLRALVETFDTSLCDLLREIAQDFAAGNAAQVHFHLHTLKGFIALFAQAPLAQAITDLYQQGRSQPLAQMATDYQRLVQPLADLQTEVRAWLGAL